MSDDAEFDAFLKGEDALSRRMQAMPQAAPSAALDAAILQRARAMMAQEARPEAANDAGAATPAPCMAGLSWRWRVPAGIAATVLAGVFAHQAFQASVDMERNIGMPAPPEQKAVILQPPAAPPAPQMEAAAPPAQATVAEAPVAVPAPRAMADARLPAPAAVSQPAPQVQVSDKARSARVQAESSMPMSEMQPVTPPAAPAPAPAPVAADSAAAPMAAAAAPERREQLYRQREQSEMRSFDHITVTGARNKAGVAPKAPAAWLAAIEAMLGNAENAEALAEWRRFRQAYPDYPVPQTTEERIKALQK